MKIGFDAKRAFFNFSGLGNYSRNIIQYLNKFFPDNSYYLYIPKKNKDFQIEVSQNQHIVYPNSRMSKRFPSFWRSFWLSPSLEQEELNIYHGLSNEIPFGIHKHQVPSVVTIHDLIFLRHPEWYGSIDRKIYYRKSLYSCKAADRIIAISEQTKNDIIHYYNISPDKIDVIYQGCDPIFYHETSEEEKAGVKNKFDLPSEYILYVGTIEKRKNLLTLVQALHKGKIQIPLVIVGRQKAYVESVKKYIPDHTLENIYFLQNVPNNDLPSLYQMARLFVYPSQFEGFGIPILEALYSHTPVITSKGGCFSEAGGEHSIYVEPGNIDELAGSIQLVLDDQQLRDIMIEKGYQHALKFNEKVIARNVMDVYRKVGEI